MHRVKRSPSQADRVGLSRVQYRADHENFGDEPRVQIKKRQKNAVSFQLNAAGGPSGEEFQE